MLLPKPQRLSKLGLCLTPAPTRAPTPPLLVQAVAIAFGMTFFDFFDVPVYWPILLLYFLSLFILTMKRQIRHMIRHRSGGRSINGGTDGCLHALDGSIDFVVLYHGSDQPTNQRFYTRPCLNHTHAHTNKPQIRPLVLLQDALRRGAGERTGHAKVKTVLHSSSSSSSGEGGWGWEDGGRVNDRGESSLFLSNVNEDGVNRRGGGRGGVGETYVWPKHNHAERAVWWAGGGGGS